MKIILLPRFSLTLITAFAGALLLAMFSATASAQSDGVIGRGFTGVAMSIDPATGLLTVESKGVFFQLIISGSALINNPPDRDVGLAGLPTDGGFRIAGLVSTAVTDDNGNVTPGILTAQNLTVIPEKATRRHKWTVAVDKQGDDLTALDEDGETTDLTGRGSGFEKGDRIILLVQSSGQGGIGEKVRGLFKAKIVGDRLDRLAQDEAGDPPKAADLASLREKREDAQETRLQKTADNAGAAFRDFVLNGVQVLQRNTEPGPPPVATEQTTSDSAQNAEPLPNTATTVVDEAPVIHITSPSHGTAVSANDVVTVAAEVSATANLVSVTFNVAGSNLTPLTTEPYTVDVTVPTGVSSVQIKVTAVDANGNEGPDSITLRVARAVDVGVKITSPLATAITVSGDSSRPSTLSGSNEAIAEGDTVSIRAEVSGTGTITVVFTVNGVDQAPIAEPPYAISHFLPLTPAAEDPPPLKITATATDGSGNTASDSVSITVVRKTTEVKVTITSPLPGAKVDAGDTIIIKAETADDSEIAFVIFSVDGVETVTTVTPFTHTHVLAPRASTTAAASSVPPNVFVGQATLNGASAPDDTVVIAWISGSDAATLTIKVTATANSGITGSASMSLQISGSVNAGEAKVKDGKYVLTAAQPSGQSFNGKSVTFTVGGKDARQTATWQKGGADIVDLAAN
ncbi:MAG: hypothetical protein BZY87_03890 [SAR202 cluster bacterium Io17-Chloro-G6]|nr:MAG: hypothetical protein BZY87_03890 [SAR202 cluster bacterium Io17-Chloro-G6]